VVLFGSQYWDEVVDFDALVRHGTINAEDVELFHRTDSVDEAFDIVTRDLTRYAMAERGATL
jgi:predicted Rossmann-fold nucleotide-binding protein